MVDSANGLRLLKIKIGKYQVLIDERDALSNEVCSWQQKIEWI